MAKTISHNQLTETLGLTLCTDGYWLYDKTRGMNLAMHVKTPEDAFVQALTYYQKRLADYEKSYACLKGQVDAFVSQFVEDDENEYRS